MFSVNVMHSIFSRSYDLSVKLWLVSSSTERLDEMLASQESMLRSQPPEADYRAATVKQRPTSRRITPAEISVSAENSHTHLRDTPGLIRK